MTSQIDGDLRADGPSPNRTCPVCGSANRCAPAQAGRFEVRCWCAGAAIGAEALARVPAAQAGVACLCPSCAAWTGPARGD